MVSFSFTGPCLITAALLIPCGLASVLPVFNASIHVGAPLSTAWREGETAFADDGTLVFCSMRPDMSIDGKVQFDMYLTRFDAHKGKYERPVNMGPTVNSEYNEQEPWITPDGSTIYFRSQRPAPEYPNNCAGNQTPGHSLFGCLWQTHKQVNGSWSEPRLMPHPINFNGTFNHCPMFLRDGKTLCFASDRPGPVTAVLCPNATGQWDLWCAEQRDDGSYSDPVKLGPQINSAENELHFYQDTQGEWVYYTSARPGGYGALDLYATRRDPETGAWEPGINLGPSINTPHNDQCSSMPPDGKSILFFSNRPGGFGVPDVDTDIYAAQLFG